MTSKRGTADEGSPTIIQLRRFDGPPRDFWPLFLRCAREITGAARATLAIRIAVPSPDGDGVVESWRPLASNPRGGARLPEASLLALALAEGIARGANVVAFSVGAEEADEGVVALETESDGVKIDLSGLVALLGALPDAWQSTRATQRLRSRLEGLSGALDLSLVVSGQDRFAAACFAACNELAARFGCERVSLAWQDDVALKLRAISQADKFDARSKIVRQAEAAMEESFDQDETLRYPSNPDSDAIVREHEAYAKEAAVAHLCSVPLRAAKETCGVWLLEREDRPFAEAEVELLRVMGDQVGPRLADLRERERWWPARLWRRLKAQAAGFLGPRHTGPKLAGVAAAMVLLFLVFGRLPYSVKAPATVRSGHVVFVTAPFDGFIASVDFEVGDTVVAGAPMLRLDTRELLVQQAAELANLNRYVKEVERARAQNALSDMRVAEAQVEQARAELERAEYRLEQATMLAPIDGVIVEGDLRRRLGAPVQQGEVLFQQTRLDELYIQVEVPERDVHEVLGQDEARMLFAAQPDQAYPLVVERIQPAGVATQSGVVFQMRARSAEQVPEWWRPGMSGTVKIDAGWRNAGWILTHRTGDWLRRQLWW